MVHIKTTTDLCRQKVSEVEELRAAVKQEARTLKNQLGQLVHLSHGTLRRVHVEGFMAALLSCSSLINPLLCL